MSTAHRQFQEETAAYLTDFMSRGGAQCIGSLACALDDGPVDPSSAPVQKARELGYQLVYAVTTQEQYPEQLKELGAWREFIRGSLVMEPDRMPSIHRYWEEKGWL